MPRQETLSRSDSGAVLRTLGILRLCVEDAEKALCSVAQDEGAAPDGVSKATDRLEELKIARAVLAQLIES